MPASTGRFEIAFSASSREPRIVLCATNDANAATMAFHTQLAELCKKRETGELMVLEDQAAQPLLRQPLHNGSRLLHLPAH